MREITLNAFHTFYVRTNVTGPYSRGVLRCGPVWTVWLPKFESSLLIVQVIVAIFPDLRTCIAPRFNFMALLTWRVLPTSNSIYFMFINSLLGYRSRELPPIFCEAIREKISFPGNMISFRVCITIFIRLHYWKKYMLRSLWDPFYYIQILGKISDATTSVSFRILESMVSTAHLQGYSLLLRWI